MDSRRRVLLALVAILSVSVTFRPVRAQAVAADPHAHHAHHAHQNNAVGAHANHAHGHQAHGGHADAQECPCAGSPRDQCDFYFTGSPTVIPTVHLQAATYRLPLTSTISTYARRDIVSIKVSSLGQVVSVPSCAAVGPTRRWLPRAPRRWCRGCSSSPAAGPVAALRAPHDPRRQDGPQQHVRAHAPHRRQAPLRLRQRPAAQSPHGAQGAPCPRAAAWSSASESEGLAHGLGRAKIRGTGPAKIRGTGPAKIRGTGPWARSPSFSLVRQPSLL